MKYKANTLVEIYKGSPVFIDGEIGKIIDRDPLGGGYAVAPLEAVIREDGDIGKLLNNHVKWADESDLKPITFNKPKKSYKEIILSFLLGVSFATSFLYFWFILVK